MKQSKLYAAENPSKLYAVVNEETMFSLHETKEGAEKSLKLRSKDEDDLEIISITKPMEEPLTPKQVHSLYNRYTYNTIETEGKGVDRYITYARFSN